MGGAWKDVTFCVSTLLKHPLKEEATHCLEPKSWNLATETKLVLLTLKRDKVVGQEIKILFGEAEDGEDCGLVPDS